jgi:hypothetical protein
MDLQKIILKLSKAELVDTLLNLVNDGLLNCENVDKFVSNSEILKQKTKKTAIFVPPTLEQIVDYCKNERHSTVDAQKFFDYFNTTKWIDSKGNKVKNWKGKIITWEGNTKYKTITKDLIVATAKYFNTLWEYYPNKQGCETAKIEFARKFVGLNEQQSRDKANNIYKHLISFKAKWEELEKEQEFIPKFENWLKAEIPNSE